MTTIAGYAYGSPAVPRAPITLQELKEIEQALLFTEEDVRYLRMSAEVVKDQTEAILDVWYGFVASLPQLVGTFAKPADGQPDPGYLAAVRSRFGRWILDTAAANFDQTWLDYQIEIGRRHHRMKKNRTDGVQASPIVPYRYLPALVYPVTATLRPFLEKKGHRPADVDGMHQAWVKAVLLSVILWSHPYVREGDF